MLVGRWQAELPAGFKRPVTLKHLEGNRFVFSSSCAVYGIPDGVPITEDHARRPVNPYGESKLFIERALRW